MKDSKTTVVVLVIIIVLALGFVVYRLVAGGGEKAEVDEEGRALDVPPEMIPEKMGGKGAPSTDVAPGGK